MTWIPREGHVRWEHVAAALRLSMPRLPHEWARPERMSGERHDVSVEVVWRVGGAALALTFVRAGIEPALPYGLAVRARRSSPYGLLGPDRTRPVKAGSWTFRRALEVRAVHPEEVARFLSAGAEKRLLQAFRSGRREWAMRVLDSAVEHVLPGDVSSMRELDEALEVSARLAVDLRALRREVDRDAAYR